MSIKVRLFLILALATGLVWLSAVLWIEGSTRSQVEQVLDARLSESANMVSSLISDHRIEVGDATRRPATVPLPGSGDYSRQLSCQIWSLRGDLVGASSGAPKSRLGANDGFSTSVIDGESWRVYSVRNDDLGVTVMVGDRMTMRDNLVHDVVAGLLWPALVILPLLAALIWVSVGRGLAPLEGLEAALRSRSPSDLSPLPTGPAPREIRPVRRALNSLFSQLERVRRTERDFTAFAAHELKTPLAGLRTQAQIARQAKDDATRGKALAAIELSVDRTDRMVRQLLDLATVEGEETPTEQVVLTELCAEISTALRQPIEARAVQLSCDIPAGLGLFTNRFLLFAALRNIAENAVLASPQSGTVRLAAQQESGRVVFRVTDEGPGIDPDDLARVTDRFFRGRATSFQGSGLGLAIAVAAANRMNGTLTFPASKKGQAVELAVALN